MLPAFLENFQQSTAEHLGRGEASVNIRGINALVVDVDHHPVVAQDLHHVRRAATRHSDGLGLGHDGGG